ncbi:MAG: fatty acid desaturase family protein [Deltaproteobacteria bacterium]|nr:fatty acid desaturase family protein [Deltaproteobacteria bacterium]
MARFSKKITDFLTTEEIRQVTRPTDRQGALAVGTSWALITGAFALAAWRPGVATIFVALVILGGRHLGLAILMHECSHRSLFRTKWLNDVVGKWLCAEPVWQHLDKYRKHHLAHHAHTGTAADPDLVLADPFPVSGMSVTRKFLRDLTGIAGAKRLYALLAMDTGYIEYTASAGAKFIDQTGRTKWDVVKTGWRNMRGMLLTNGVLLGVLALAGHAWLYLLWIGAYLTTFSLFVRVRSMAEHGCTDKTDDQLYNTRTIIAGPIARLTVAPHRVNYHLEHHLLATTPHYKLKRLHKLLKERGLYDKSHIAKNYGEVLRIVTTPAS